MTWYRQLVAFMAGQPDADRYTSPPNQDWRYEIDASEEVKRGCLSRSETSSE